MSDLISKKELYHKLGEAYNKGFLSWGANEVIKDIIGECDSFENKCFDGTTNREIISKFVERDDSFAIMVDKVNGTVNIELSLDFWNAPYQKGGNE